MKQNLVSHNAEAELSILTLSHFQGMLEVVMCHGCLRLDSHVKVTEPYCEYSKS